jgi:hypothetical protein
MAKKSPITALLFDDNQDYCRALKLRASEHSILITFRHSWDIAFEELADNHARYQFVILDAKSFLREDQAPGSENIDSVIKAIMDIKDLQGKVKHPIPFCINTGFTEFKSTFEATTRIFEKGQDTTLLFNYIKQEVEKLPETKIRNQYFKIFQVFELGYLDFELDSELVNIIKRVQGINETTENSILRDLRPFLEAIFSNLNSRIQGFIPAKLIRGNSIELGGVIKFLGGSPEFNKTTFKNEPTGTQYMPAHIYTLTKALKDCISDAAMHYNGEQTSSYLVLSQFYSLLEIILWYKEFMDENT